MNIGKFRTNHRICKRKNTWRSRKKNIRKRRKIRKKKNPFIRKVHSSNTRSNTKINSSNTLNNSNSITITRLQTIKSLIPLIIQKQQLWVNSTSNNQPITIQLVKFSLLILIKWLPQQLLLKTTTSKWVHRTTLTIKVNIHRTKVQILMVDITDDICDLYSCRITS